MCENYDHFSVLGGVRRRLLLLLLRLLLLLHVLLWLSRHTQTIQAGCVFVMTHRICFAVTEDQCTPLKVVLIRPPLLACFALCCMYIAVFGRRHIHLPNFCANPPLIRFFPSSLNSLGAPRGWR